MNKFLDKLFSSKSNLRSNSLSCDKNGDPAGDELRLATAALLIEVCAVHSEIHDSEVRVIRESLAQEFNLDETMLCRTIDLASQARKQAKSVDRIAQTLCEAYSIEQRVVILAMAWRITLSDGVFDKFEKRILGTLQFRLGLDEDSAEEARVMAEQGRI